MPTPFGPQLIGETEKTLNAILRRALHGTGLTEPQWVSLRVADQLDGHVDADGLAAAITARAHFDDSVTLVHDLAARGLLDDGRLTAEGRRLVASVQTVITETAAPVWHDLPADDVAATARVLNVVVARARRVLDDDGPGRLGSVVGDRADPDVVTRGLRHQLADGR